jgi:hypothetical protein
MATALAMGWRHLSVDFRCLRRPQSLYLPMVGVTLRQIYLQDHRGDLFLPTD